MKKIIFITLAVFIISLLTWSCSDENKTVEPELSFVQVDLPSYVKSNAKTPIEVEVVDIDVKVTKEDGSEVYGKMRFTVPLDETETLVNFEMTENIFLETELNTDFWIKYNDLDGSKGIGTCLKACNGIEKGEGRGWCKAGCWGELAVKVATVVVAIVAL